MCTGNETDGHETTQAHSSSRSPLLDMCRMPLTLEVLSHGLFSSDGVCVLDPGVVKLTVLYNRIRHLLARAQNSTRLCSHIQASVTAAVCKLRVVSGARALQAQQQVLCGLRSAAVAIVAYDRSWVHRAQAEGDAASGNTW